MSGLRALSRAAIALLPAVLLAFGGANAPRATAADPEPVRIDDPRLSIASDAKQLANEANLSAADVSTAIDAQLRFSAYAEGVAAQHPGRISAIWIDPMPGTRGHIGFVGSVPENLKAPSVRHRSPLRINMNGREGRSTPCLPMAMTWLRFSINPRD
jgi:hypothetical protein